MRPHTATLFLAALLLAAPLPAGAAVFDQGPVQPRDFRNPTLAAAARASGIETESLFGFTLGSDVDPAGSRGLALETVLGHGRRSGRYSAATAKLEAAYGATDTVSVSLGLLAGFRSIQATPGLAQANALRPDGLGTELRWRLLNRETAPVGLTLHIEPSYRLHDETTGEPGHGIAAENKLILDQALLPGRLYGALNLIYDVEQFRPRGGTTARASTAGLAAALTVQLTKGVFLGAELRHLRAFDGLALERPRGQATFAGPTLFWTITPALWLSASLNLQVAGAETGRSDGLDLANFNRLQARLKLGTEF